MTMSWSLIGLAEMWRMRWSIGFPLLLAVVFAGAYTLRVPEPYEARALLQIQSDATRSPMLRDISAPGHADALRGVLTNPDLLADTGKDAGQVLYPSHTTLRVLNDHMLEIGYRSDNPQGLEKLNDLLSYNFIQGLLAPERMRIEQTITQNKQELEEISGRLATSDGKDSVLRSQLTARQGKLESDTVQLQSELRLVNDAFSARGSQGLIWFAEPSTLMPHMDFNKRLLRNMLVALVMAGALLWILRYLPRGSRKTVADGNQAHDVSGMPLAGTLPWLGKVRVTPHGLRIKAQGKNLNPSDFSEVGRLQRTLVRNLRGPLVLLGVSGEEGVSTLAYMLAERTAAMGKRVILVDMNLKNRSISQWFGLGDGNWALPKETKGKKDSKKENWNALHSLADHKNLLMLAAPRHPETLQKLGDAGGLPALFDHLGSLADVVIVDASPLAAVNRGNIDAMSVAAVGARTVLVAQASVTPRSDLKRACDSLLLAGAPLLGVVLNLQFSLSRRQLLGQLADHLRYVLPPLGSCLRKAAIRARLD